MATFTEAPYMTVHNNSCTVFNAADVAAPGVHCPPPRPNTALEKAVAVATMLAAFGGVWASPFTTGFLLYATFVCRSVAAATVLALLIADFCLPAGGAWPFVIHHWAWDCWRRYFSTRCVLPSTPFLDPSRHYLFAHYPHGCFPMGSFLSISLTDAPDTGLPYTKAAIASVNLTLPIVKHIFGWMGCIHANKQDIIKTLKSYSVGIAPEGIAGVFSGASQNRERVYALKHKGFCKVALQAGVDIVPVYMLGQTCMLDFIGPAALSRRLRITIGTFYGAWGLPLPRPHPMIQLVGRPIAVRQVEQPSQEQVEELHARVIAGLRELYDAHRAMLPGWENRKLELL